MKTIAEEIQTIFPINVASRPAPNLSTFGGPSSSAGSSPSMLLGSQKHESQFIPSFKIRSKIVCDITVLKKPFSLR